jgi:hypothetical protein
MDRILLVSVVFSSLAEASQSSGMQSITLSELGKENTTRIKFIWNIRVT